MAFYKVFDSEFFTLVNNNEMLVSTLNKVTDTSFEVTGETTPYNDLIQLTWYSKDNINHGYIRHNTDTNYEGKIIEFSVGNVSNVVFYNDTSYEQNFILKTVSGEELKIPMISLGKTIRGRYTTNRLSTINVGQTFLVKGTIDLSYTVSNGIVDAKEGTDYIVNYEKGYINILTDKIPSDSIITVVFEYYSHIDFKIDFSKLNIDVSNVEYFSIPIQIKKGLGEGKYFSFSINNIKTENCEISPIPSNLKINDIKLCEDFRYVRNYNNDLICRTIDKLGFKRELVINIGNGDFANITGADIVFSKFNRGFLDWYSQICKKAKLKGMTNIKVVIPFENKYFDKKYLQKTKGRKYLDKLNPINPEVLRFYKELVRQLFEITTDLTLDISFEGFNYQVDLNENLGVFDDFTMSLFRQENPNQTYLLKGNLSEYKKTTTKNDVEVANWLSRKLKAAYNDLSSVKKADLIVDERLIYNDDFLTKINSIDGNWTASFKTIHIKHSNWVEDFYNYINRIDIVKNRFAVDFTRIGYILDLDNYYKENDLFRFVYYNKVLKAIDELKNVVEIKNITLNSGLAIRGDSLLVYKIVPYVALNKVENELDVALCRANKETICYMPSSVIKSLKRVVDDTDEIKLEIPYYTMDRFEHKKIKNYFYDDIKAERLLRINENEYFVIKTVKENIGTETIKEVTALALEHKLSKRTVVLEDTVMQLYSEQGDKSDTLGILNLLEDETGWSVGYIDTEVQFEVVEGVKKAKVRWFESIDSSWYTFLTDTVSTSFDCLMQFDTLNKRVNVFKNTHVGDDRGLYLTEDNYIRNLAITDSTNDIVTRLTCVGKDEMGIHSVNITGQGYIDNFAYFIENGDLSKELVDALAKYDVVAQRLNVQWGTLSTSRFNKNQSLKNYKKEHTTLVGEINALKAIKESYEQAGDKVNADRIQKDIDIKVARKLELESKMTQLEEEIRILDLDISKTNAQLDPKNTVDEKGKLIFTKALLDERQEFIYHDVWVDDTYLDEKTLFESGKQQLDLLCRPTTDYGIDVVNFLERIGKRKGFNGELYLRDVVMLKTETSDKELELYLVGYEYSPSDKTLTLSLSNKFKTSNGTKMLGDILSESKRISRTVNIKKHLWQKVKGLV